MSSTAWCRRSLLLSAQPLWGGQALCLLDHGELPELRDVCLQRGVVQPRAGETFVTRKITRGLARVDAEPTTASTWATSTAALGPDAMGRRRLTEVGRVATPVVVVPDPRYFPAEVETLLGDPSEAREKLGWTPPPLWRNWWLRWWRLT